MKMKWKMNPPNEKIINSKAEQSDLIMSDLVMIKIK
jgi:hypothetical protein